MITRDKTTVRLSMLEEAPVVIPSASLRRFAGAESFVQNAVKGGGFALRKMPKIMGRPTMAANLVVAAGAPRLLCVSTLAQALGPDHTRAITSGTQREGRHVGLAHPRSAACRHDGCLYLH